MKAEWIFQQGCAFSDCAQALEIENRMKYDVFFATHTHAAIALSAFASELFIKCLLEKYNEPYGKTHALDKLWEKYRKVDERSADRIEQCIEQYFENKTQRVFDRMISESSNAFAEWRYSYEGKELKINRNFIIAFRNVLKDECCLKIYGLNWVQYIKQNE